MKNVSKEHAMAFAIVEKMSEQDNPDEIIAEDMFIEIRPSDFIRQEGIINLQPALVF